MNIDNHLANQIRSKLINIYSREFYVFLKFVNLKKCQFAERLTKSFVPMHKEIYLQSFITSLEI